MSWSGTSTYSWSSPSEPRRITTSRTELLHLGVAYAVLTGCLTLLFSGETYIANGFGVPGFIGISPVVVLAAALAALTGFVAHEMAHKVAAQRMGFWAEFRASTYGLLMAAFTSFIGFILAAPGATVVSGMSGLDQRSWGRTSIAGPLTNLGFAVVFYAGAAGAYLLGSGLFIWLLIIAYINAWFGTFNLFPFGVLDGRKVFRWNKGVWAAALCTAAAASVITYLAAEVFVSPFLWWF